MIIFFTKAGLIRVYGALVQQLNIALSEVCTKTMVLERGVPVSLI